MTIAQMQSYFLILMDKFGGLYYTDQEFEAMITRGQLDVLSGLLPADGSELNIELNQNTLMGVAPLLFSVSGLNMNATTGKVLRSDIDLAVGHNVMRILSIGWNGLRPVKYTRKNNWYSYIQNAFKAPSDNSPRVHELADSWVFLPKDATIDLTFTGIRYPLEVSVAGGIGCELPDIVHNDIVARALEIAGVGSRDQMLGELKKLNNV